MRNIIPLTSMNVTTLPTAELSHRVRATGACVGAPDPDAWFPAEPDERRGASPEALGRRRAQYEETARALCRGCAARAECLELALREERNLPRTWIQGIRGGLAPWQRRNLLRTRKRHAAAGVSA